MVSHQRTSAPTKGKPADSKPGVLGRLGDVVYRRARLILVISGIFLVGAGILAAGAMGKVKVGGYDWDDKTRENMSRVNPDLNKEE